MRAPIPATIVLLASVLGAWAPACGENLDVPTDAATTAASGLGGATVGDGGGGEGGDGGDGGAGGAAPGTGGGVSVVRVGLIANAVREGVPPATRIDEVEAAASAYAAGARVAAVKRHWADADVATLAADAELARAGCASAPSCRPVAFTLAVVDGALDGRPEELIGDDWSSAASEDAIDAAVDAIFEAFGEDLAVLAIGARVDRWVALHEEDEEALSALLGRAVERAQQRGGDGLLVGVGVSGDGALAAGGPAVALRALGTATMTSLFPGMHDVSEGATLPSPAAAAQVLDAIDGIDPGRPVALVEVGYPSSSSLGSSEDAQTVFFGSLFAALDTRRESFPFVVASRLHDLGDGACAAEGVELGEEDEQVLAYRCSTGLRSEEDTPKPAWTSLLAGIAKLASGGTASGP